MSARPVVAGWGVLPLPGGRAVVFHRRAAAAAAILLLVAVATAVCAVCVGTYDLGPSGVMAVLSGGGSDLDRFIVLGQRLPRAVAGLAAGAALGLSGAIFQSLTRNPLGSPDVVGFTTGASTGGLVAIIALGAPSALGLAAAATVGGLVTAAVVVVLTVRRGIGGDRLILAGIAVGAMLASLNDYLVSRAPLETAEAAKTWKFGSLQLVGWEQAAPLALLVAVMLPVAAAATRSARVLDLGDDAARGLGARTERQRLALVVIGVVLVAGAVAAAGPIGFVALAAPQLARRLARTPGIPLAPSMAMGAALLVAADIAAQRLLSPFQIPVGLVSAAFGGLYLLWLLGFARD